MIVFWLFAGVLSLATIAALLIGARKPDLTPDGRTAATLSIYKDQLAELEKDVAAGLVTAAEAEAQRTEIGRRILTISREQEALATVSAPRLKWAVLIVPLLAGAIYWQVGRVGFPDVPRESRLAEAEKNNDFEALVARVEIHLEKNPGDVQGWQLLVPNYLNAGRFNDAANAINRIITISGPTAELYASMGEALVFGNNGLMNQASIASMKEALKLDPKLPKALYYNAMAMAQEGKKAEANAAFTALLAASPSDAPWRKAVEGQLAQLAPNAAAPQISEEQMQGAAGMTPEERQTMIRSMVDGLDEKLKVNPNDVEGWLRLIRARTVLNEADKASTALAAARTAFASDAEKLKMIDALALELNLK